VFTSAVFGYCLTGIVQIIVWLSQNRVWISQNRVWLSQNRVWLSQNRVWLLQMPDEFPKIVNLYDEAAFRN
jgi:hypothetical protein